MTAAPEDDDPYEQLEAEAAELLDALPGDPEASAKPLIDKLRKQLAGRAKQEQAAYDRGRAEALAEVKTQAEREQALDRYGIPKVVRALLDGVDVSDDEAMKAKVAELQAGGVTWAGQPARSQPGQTAAPEPQAPPPDPAAIVGQFQQAQASGAPPAGGLLGRVA